MKKRNWFATLGVLAAISVMGATAQAVALPGDDATILIERAINSPTLTVRYAGVAATMVELKINGTSFGSRPVESKNKKGETAFTLDLNLLADGENEIEVRLFDQEGRLVGSQKSTITTDDSAKGPVYLVNPKVGATVMGPVEIKVGFGRELRNSYVSFFVNGQFKSMTNTPPYAFVWDTSREANGWHEIEAWVVDESTNTFKTRKVRVFVDNPGGRTNRTAEPVTAGATPNPAAGNPKAAKNPAVPVAAANPAPTAATPATPKVPGVAASNDVNPALGARANAKPVEVGGPIEMGHRSMTPSITKAGAAKPVVAKADPPATMVIKVSNPKVVPTTNAAPVSIERGTRLPSIGTFSILLNSSPVTFDVQPRVQDGVPLTPFRALFEQAGGKVDWENLAKALTATGMGKEVSIKIGDKVARVNKIEVSLEIAPFLERGRTIVPLSFIREGLDVDVQYDPATGHVLITSKKAN